VIGFLIIVGAETGKTFIIEIGLNWINSPDENIKPQVKFLSV
jgi:hypothetical protein